MSNDDEIPTLNATDAVRILDALDAAPGPMQMAKAAARFDEMAAVLSARDVRLACLSSFTFEPLVMPLRLAALRAGLRTNCWTAPFDQSIKTLLDQNAGLDAFEPNVVLLADRLADRVPELYDGCGVQRADEIATKVSAQLDQLAGALAAFRRRHDAIILIQLYERPTFSVAARAEVNQPGSQIAIWRDAIERVRRLAEETRNCCAIDYDELVAFHGRSRWTDPRTELFGRIPIAAGHYWHYAKFIVRHLVPLAGLSKKAVVLDADNTLWGGIVGDDGPDGLHMGHDFPGNAYIRFQRRLLALQERGILLCIASKNEPGVVERLIETHPDILLRPEHFACIQANWNPKPDNLRRIAAILNIGTDAMVFIDDSAVECALMRETVPEVLTVQLPQDPARYASVLESLDCFDQFHSSAEDINRGAMYRAEAGRRQFAEAATDLPTFYRGLDMRLTLHLDDPRTARRLAQMTQRTNQFNMNTIRCTEDDICGLIDASDRSVVALALCDRFGDAGIVGMAVLREAGDDRVLDMLLMSCRVLGRTIETTFLRWLGGWARARGSQRLIGIYAPTPRNRPFGSFYADAGFTSGEAPDAAVQHWEWALEAADTSIPEWFQIEVQGTT